MVTKTYISSNLCDSSDSSDSCDSSDISDNSDSSDSSYKKKKTFFFSLKKLFFSSFTIKLKNLSCDET